MAPKTSTQDDNTLAWFVAAPRKWGFSAHLRFEYNSPKIPSPKFSLSPEIVDILLPTFWRGIMTQQKVQRLPVWQAYVFAVLFVLGSATMPMQAVAASGAASGFMERNTDRTGGDFRVFTSGPQGPRHCASECASDAQCKAWTYVAMGNEGPNATCHLKLVVPPAVQTPCCISGVTVGSSTPGRRTGY